MLKQALTTGIIALGCIMATPAMAHNTNHNYHSHDFQVIQPVRHPARPAHKCVSGAKVDRLQANQNRRIHNGIKQGKLVKWEIKKLKQQQRRIRKAEQRMRNSGHCLTRHEVRKLMKRLNNANHQIRSLKQNNVRRGYGRGHGHGHNNHHRGGHR